MMNVLVGLADPLNATERYCCQAARRVCTISGPIKMKAQEISGSEMDS